MAISALAGATLFDAFVRLGMPYAARAAVHLLTSWLGWAAVVAYVLVDRGGRNAGSGRQE